MPKVDKLMPNTRYRIRTLVDMQAEYGPLVALPQSRCYNSYMAAYGGEVITSPDRLVRANGECFLAKGWYWDRCMLEPAESFNDG
jgi:hypothetical protein